MEEKTEEPTGCAFCERDVALTEHHLIPRAVHRKQRFIDRFGKEEMRQRKLLLCRLCHRAIHRFIPDEKELARDYNTPEALLAHEGLQRHIAWARKQRE
jgi:hypothetical protein